MLHISSKEVGTFYYQMVLSNWLKKNVLLPNMNQSNALD